jgi:predicted Zn-dependent protease
MNKKIFGSLATALLLMFSCNVSAFSLNIGDVDIGGIAKAIEGATEMKQISQEKEIIMGQEIAANLLGAAGLVQDRELHDYINKLGLWLALQTDRPDLPWTFGVLDDDDVNAFATPGGYIFVTKGLFRIMRNEAELAGVLSHEISHVIAYHHVEALQDQGFMKLVSGVTEATIDENDRDMVEFAMNASQELYIKGLDKSDEYEADRMGVVIAARGGFDPFGLPACLQTLDGISAEDSRIALLFKTHPLPADRLVRLDETMGSEMDKYTGYLGDTARFQQHLAQLQ